MEGATFVATCRRVATILAEHAPEGDERRRLPEATLAAVDDADLRRAVVPASLGGHGLALGDLCEGTRELAHGCPASAWTVSFLMLHAWMLTRLPEAGRADVFGGGAVALAAAPLAPTGTLTPVGGGYRVSGRWEWATAVRHADWVIVHGIDVGAGAGVDISTRFAVLAIDQVRVEDVWCTSGMRATGSDTVVVDDVVVPASRTSAANDLFEPGRGAADDRLAPLPLISVLALTASAAAVGAAEAAHDLYLARLADRVLAYSPGDRASEQPVAQSRLGTVIAEVAALLGGWRAAIDDVERASNDDGPDDLLRVRTRLAAAAAVRASRRIISTVADGAGAGVYFTSNPFQRIQRDVETLKGHAIFDWDRTTELAGRVALGAALRPTDLA